MWLVNLLCVLVVVCLVLAIVVWTKRYQKRKALEYRLESWSKNCTAVHPEDTIFVLIPTASRTPSAELLPTLESLFLTAFCPHRISIGVVTAAGDNDKQQLFPGGDTDRESFPYTSRFAHQVRLAGECSDEGASPARAAGLSSLLRSERWILVVHAHTTFVPGWDRQLVLEHGGVRRRVLTLLGEAPGGGPEFPAVHDLDRDGVPLFRSREFAAPPASPHRAISASSRALFGRSSELRLEGVMAFSDLLFAKPHVDDLMLTFSLRTRGFELLSPTRAIISHDTVNRAVKLASAVVSSRTTTVPLRHPWLSRLGLLTLHAYCACLFAESALERVLDKDHYNNHNDTLDALLALSTALPWVSVGIGKACIGPQMQRALAFVERHGLKRKDVTAHFQQLGTQSVLARAGLARPEARQDLLRMLLSSVRESAGRHMRAGTSEWEKLVGVVVLLNSESIQRALEAVRIPLHTVQHEMGIDIRDGSVHWQAFMGVGPDGPANQHEMRESFGSQQAFELERSRRKRESY